MKIIHTNEEKILAKTLREEGKSYGEIGNILNVSKALIRYWCDNNARLNDNNHRNVYNKQYYLNHIQEKSEYARTRREEMPDHVNELKRKSREKIEKNVVN